MSFRAPTIHRSVFAGIALAMAGSVHAQLATKSPFLPPQSAAAGAPTAGAPLEFRAYMTTSEGTRYWVYNPTRKLGAWVKLNERNAELEVTVRQHDEAKESLIVEHQGKTLTLAERKAKVVSSGAAAQAMPPPAPATNVGPAVTQTVVLNPTPADEQKRLDAVAAEVARRRALREQATQQMGQTPAPGPTPQVGPARPGTPLPPGPQPPGSVPESMRGRGPVPGAPRQQ
ncbi:hypothetical protein [Horticoccus sp. 23ND18S-11]|uniref:hypothetical protein n=1 Tax=Horticoccus sp. 23ND18S-11 TaxID=3391832 RepID=UPI0039C93DA4